MTNNRPIKFTTSTHTGDSVVNLDDAAANFLVEDLGDLYPVLSEEDQVVGFYQRAVAILEPSVLQDHSDLRWAREHLRRFGLASLRHLGSK